MLFKLSDNKTLIAFHHNRHHDFNYSGLSGAKKRNYERSVRNSGSLYQPMMAKPGANPVIPGTMHCLKVLKVPSEIINVLIWMCLLIMESCIVYSPHRWQRALYVHF
jgi:hypothetical protein